MMTQLLARGGAPLATAATRRCHHPPAAHLPPRRAHGRSCHQPPRASSSEDTETSRSKQQAIEVLVQRAQQLRTEQARMEQEAEQLAAALEGLPAAQQHAVLEALGLQQKKQQEQQAASAAAPQAVPPGEGQVQGHAWQQPPAELPGSDDWLAVLPAHLQQQMKDSGLATVLQQQAEAVRREEEWANSERFGGGDMEALARMIEEGQELPPLPPEEWEGEPEPADEFNARLKGSIDYVNADLKGSKHPKKQRKQRPCSTAAGEAGVPKKTRLAAASGEGGAADGNGNGGGQEEAAIDAGGGSSGGVDGSEEPEAREREMAEAEAAAAQHTADTHAMQRAAQLFAGRPTLAAAYARGWEQAKEWDRVWVTGEVNKLPMTEEVRRSVPAPPLPPEARRVFKAAERLAYVLRRAHKDSTDPDAPLLALQSKGLASEELLFQDPFIQCPSLERAIKYLKRLRLAGATLDCANIMLRCGNYRPQMEWRVTVDCYLDFPYPPWFYSWVNMNHGAASAAAAASLAGSGTGDKEAAAAAGPFAAVGMVAQQAVEAAALAEEQRQEEEDVALLDALLEAATAAAKAAGQVLDNEAILAVMKTAAGVALRKRAQRQEAEERAAAAAMEASADADAAMAEEDRKPRGSAWRDPDPAELAPPELLEVHSEPYCHEGQRRQHRWVLMDFEERDRQRGRQQFDVYPRNPAAMAAAEAEEQAQKRVQEEEDEEVAFQRLLREQRRLYGLLQPASLLREDWGLEWLIEAQALAQQEQQQQPDDGRQPGGGTGAASTGSIKKQRKETAARAAGQQQGQQGQQEIFPFTYDWERQQRRREAGEELRQLLGGNFERAMMTIPHMGRTRGRNSNAALNQEEDREGTAWLGGECMTVQVTFSYTMDADSCLVDTCAIHWGAVHGLHLQEVTDAFDIYLEAIGLLHEAERVQDKEEEEALLHQLAPGTVLRDAADNGNEREEGGGACLLPLWRQCELLAQEELRQQEQR